MNYLKKQNQLSIPLPAIVSALLSAILLAACGSAPKAPAPTSSSTSSLSTSSNSATPSKVALPKAGSGRGGYYKDDGPGDNPPPDLELILDAEPKVEPYSKAASKPYVIFGKTYTPMTDNQPFSERGVGSWYGKKYHGLRTSSGEVYDMYKMTAAHPTLPIPSYARITNLSNGRQVIVKINDRGPFHSNRIVDLSYTAALKLDYLHSGSSELLLERLLPVDIEKMAENKKNNIKETLASNASTQMIKQQDGANFETLVATNAKLSDPENVSAKVPASVSVNLANDVPLATNLSNNASKFYLQFGAFGLRSNAEATFNRLQNQLIQLPTLEIVQQGMLYRLFSGPFATRDEANNAMQFALNAGIPKPIIVQR